LEKNPEVKKSVSEKGSAPSPGVKSPPSELEAQAAKPGIPKAETASVVREAAAGNAKIGTDSARLVHNTLGVAEYRCGRSAEALATLMRSNALNEEKEPSDLAFLALAQHRLGQPEKARDTLRRLREVMKDPQQSGNPESQAFLREAETIELDRVFPADPFAR
jgi:hypothetical protein